MDETQFWEIIESGGPQVLGDPDAQLEAVRRRLAERSPEELIAFDALFNEKMDEAYTWDLWGAAYLINGGCSDDGFAYFRAWLISRGGEAFSAAVREPDTLAGLVDPEEGEYDFEELWGLAQEVYEESVGGRMPAGSSAGLRNPKGRRWDFDDDETLERKLPKLCALYL